MRQYRYQGWNGQGERLEGVVHGSNKHIVIDQMKKREIWLTDIQLDLAATIKGKGGLGLKEQVLLFRKLSFALASGVDLLSSLALVKHQRNSTASIQFIQYLEQQLNEGRSLSESINDVDGIHTIVSQMIVIGEHNGRLDEALNRASDYLEQFLQLKGNVLTALLYPSLIIALTMVATQILLCFVLPALHQVIYGMGSELPLFTAVLLGISSWAVRIAPYWPIILVLLVAGTGAIHTWWQRTEREISWRIPVITSFIDRYTMVQLTRGLGELLHSGISVVVALETVKASLGSNSRSRQLDQVIGEVIIGNSLSSGLTQCTFMTADVLELIRIGENSGRTSEVLLKTSEFYHQEMTTQVERLPKYIEPILIIILGIVVGGVVIGMFAPMMTMYNGLG